jgi:hypothetical protein
MCVLFLGYCARLPEGVGFEVADVLFGVLGWERHEIGLSSEIDIRDQRVEARQQKDKEIN